MSRFTHLAQGCLWYHNTPSVRVQLINGLPGQLLCMQPLQAMLKICATAVLSRTAKLQTPCECKSLSQHVWLVTTTGGCATDTKPHCDCQQILCCTCDCTGVRTMSLHSTLCHPCRCKRDLCSLQFLLSYFHSLTCAGAQGTLRLMWM